LPSINTTILTTAKTQPRSVILNTIGSSLTFRSILPGELPPPAPRDCFGRDELIEKVVGFAENLKPVALIGAGGIGKTSIALKVLHHNWIKQRFGGNRRFIRCDQFPASRSHFLARLSKAIGAGVENPEDLTPLRPLLSSKEMLIVIDNAESILDPKGTDAEEIYSVVDELCQFETICLLITSRITTVPPRCRRPEIPTLSMEAACDIFYDIYNDHGRSSTINDLLERLDFHPLSITLLATTASHNAWDYDRLTAEWNTQRARVLQTDYNKSLAATIELSLDSPTFRSLGPNARDLLGVVAFFPQGVNEKNLDWLFPTVSNGKNTFDKFCALSLTRRSNGFVTMLAPIRDYLNPQDPRTSPLLCAVKSHYFSRLSAGADPGMPGFEERRWIVSEDVNAEHLIDVFTTIDPGRDDTWVACRHFVEHLTWHKPRQTMLKSKIEALPDDHPSKSKCLGQLSQLLGQMGNDVERKRLLTHTLELERRRGDDSQVAYTLQQLCSVNRNLHLYKEGIQQAKEALEIFKRTGNTRWQMQCSSVLSWMFFQAKQLDAAEDVASRAIGLALEEGQEILVCRLHRVLGNIYRSKGEKMKAIHHFETAIGIASRFDWHDVLFWNHFDLAMLFCDEGEFNNANAHAEQTKLHAVNDTYKLGRAMQMQANVWDRQNRLEEARSEALQALEMLEKLGATSDAEDCRKSLQMVERALRDRSTSSQGKPLKTNTASYVC
jgi:tetratricopeptide (TPR) repeat protein